MVKLLLSVGSTFTQPDKKGSYPFDLANWKDLVNPSLIVPLQTQIATTLQSIEDIRRSNECTARQVEHHTEAARVKAQQLFQMSTKMDDHTVALEQLNRENNRQATDIVDLRTRIAAAEMLLESLREQKRTGDTDHEALNNSIVLKREHMGKITALGETMASQTKAMKDKMENLDYRLSSKKNTLHSDRWT